MGPARLCLRRRCRACRDISRTLRDYRAECDFLPVALAAPRRLGSIDTMNPDTAELAIADTASELPAAGAPGRRRRGRAAAAALALRAPRGAARAAARCAPIRARMAAVRDSWRALWSSRLLVWAAGVGDAADVRLRARARTPSTRPA